MTPLISIVIPTRNRPDLLARAVESVLAQDYRPLEIVVVDDGSTDSTPEVAARYVREHPTIVRLIRQDNRGSPFPHNNGIRQSRGEFVGLLADDDEFMLGKLQAQMDVLGRTGTRVAFTAYWRSSQDADQLVRLPDDALVGCVIDSAYLRNALLQGCVVLDCTMLAERELLFEYGLLDEQLPTCSDWDLFLRLAFAGVQMAYLQHPYVRYRVHPSTISHQAGPMNDASEAMFKKLFARDNLEPDVRRREAEVLARCYLNAALRCARAKDAPGTRLQLWRAVRQRPASLRPGWIRMYLKSVL